MAQPSVWAAAMGTLGGSEVVDVHPYQSAWSTRDPAAWADAMAPDIVLHSPLLPEHGERLVQ
jgi:hypothetical protein